MQHVQQLERDWQKIIPKKRWKRGKTFNNILEYTHVHTYVYVRVESVCINAATASFTVFAVAVC